MQNQFNFQIFLSTASIDSNILLVEVHSKDQNTRINCRNTNTFRVNTFALLTFFFAELSWFPIGVPAAFYYLVSHTKTLHTHCLLYSQSTTNNQVAVCIVFCLCNVLFSQFTITFTRSNIVNHFSQFSSTFSFKSLHKLAEINTENYYIF